MHRYELSDQQWARIEPLLSPSDPSWQGGAPVPRSPPDGQRHPLDPPHRGSLAGPPGTLRTLGDSLLPLQPLAGRTGPGSASSRRCWTTWTTSARSTMICGASTARTSAPAAPPPGHAGCPAACGSWAGEGGPAAGAVGSCPGAIAGRLRHKDPPGLRQPWDRGGDPHHSGSGPREQGLRADHGPAVVPPPPWQAPMAPAAGRRQGLQLPEDPALVPEEEDQAGDPDPEEPASGKGLQQGDV